MNLTINIIPIQKNKKMLLNNHKLRKKYKENKKKNLIKVKKMKMKILLHLPQTSMKH